MGHVMVFGTKSATEEEVERALIKEQEYYEALQAAMELIELLMPTVDRNNLTVMAAVYKLQNKMWTIPVFKSDNEET